MLLLYKPMFAHVKHMLTKYQHGFIKNRSTTTNIFSVAQFISQSIDNFSQVDSKLSFVPHINKLINSSYRIIEFILRNFFNFNNIETRKIIYYS